MDVKDNPKSPDNCLKSKQKRTLTPKQAKFCVEYLVDLNATQATIRAGYSARTAGHKASALVVDSCIQERIAELRIKLQETTISPKDVLDELSKIGFSNIQSFIGGENEIKDISELTAETAAAVESIQSDIRHDSGKSDGYTEKVKIKLCSKLGALEKIGNILGIFENKVKINADISINLVNYGDANPAI